MTGSIRAILAVSAAVCASGAWAKCEFWRAGEKSAMFDLAQETILKGLVVPGPDGAHGFVHPYFAPGANYGDNWWEIDSSAALEAWKWIDFGFSMDAMRNFPLVQKSDGRIPLWGADTLPVSENHSLQSDNASALPVVTRPAYDIAKMSGDRAFVLEMYEMSKRYLEWWLNDRLDAGTGLVSSLFEETFPPYLGRANEYCGVDTCVLVALGLEWTANLARMLGRDSEAAELDAKSAAVFSAARTHMWDETAGLFRPYILASGGLGFESAEGFYMFADRSLPSAVKERLLASLKGPRFGWDAYPLMSMAVDSPEFTMTKGERRYQYNASWSGMVWSLIDRWAVHALFRAGLDSEATHLASKMVAMIDAAGTFDEFYAPDDGSAQGGEYYVWTAANYITAIVEDLCGISYDAETRRLSVEPRIADDFRFEHLACGTNGYATVVRTNGVVSVLYHRFVESGYVEATGTQYIDTGIACSPSMTVEAEIIPLDNARLSAPGAQSAIFGSSWSPDGFFFMFHEGNIRYNAGGEYVDVPGGESTWRVGEKVKLVAKADSFSVNETGRTLGNGRNTTDSICFFWTGGNPFGLHPEQYGGAFRLCSAKIYDGERLVADFRPAVCSPDGTAGLFDLVGRRFHTAVGSGLLAGPAIVKDNLEIVLR